MVHRIEDDREPIGRPAIVREKVLACLQTLRRARVERICEETGAQARSVHDILVKAHARGEVTRVRHSRYYVYEVSNG